jgi:hypothetical protein
MSFLWLPQGTTILFPNVLDGFSLYPLCYLCGKALNFVILNICLLCYSEEIYFFMSFSRNVLLYAMFKKCGLLCYFEEMLSFMLL